MTTLIYSVIIVVSSLILIKAVALFISSSSKLAKHIGISEFTISFLLVAIATSLPETIVGVTSAIQENPILSYGNAVGSNVALVTLIIALPIILGSRISTRFIIHSKDIYYSTFFAFMPLMLAVDGTITQLDGLILLVSYIFYSLTILKRSHGTERILETFDKTNVYKELFIFIISLVLLLGASEGIVRSAISISESMGWALGFVGVTLTAVGTSLPEIAYALGASKKNQQDEILGNIIGSVVANSTFVLGLTSMISPIKLKGSNFGASTIFFLILSMLFFLKFTKSKERLDKQEAIILLSIYIIFVLVQYKLQY